MKGTHISINRKQSSLCFFFFFLILKHDLYPKLSLINYLWCFQNNNISPFSAKILKGNIQFENLNSIPHQMISPKYWNCNHLFQHQKVIFSNQVCEYSYSICKKWKTHHTGKESEA